MSEYIPDHWIILKVNTSTPHYRVLGGWSGSYIYGDSWRLNSGITSHKFDDNYWYFYGSSGSCYECHVDRYGLSGSMVHVYHNLREKYGKDVVQLVGDQQWNKKEWDWLLGEIFEHK
jgi:hypothetical protein